MKVGFLKAFISLMADRDALIEDCRLAQTILCDTNSIVLELAKLLEEVEVVTELSRKTIAENAHTGMNQEAFDERNNRYLERYQQARARIEFLELEKQRLIAKSKILDRFIEDIRNRPLVIAEWDVTLWFAVIGRVTVAMGDSMIFTFRNGSEAMI